MSECIAVIEPTSYSVIGSHTLRKLPTHKRTQTKSKFFKIFLPQNIKAFFHVFIKVKIT